MVQKENSERIKERNRVKRSIAKKKLELVKLSNKLKETRGVPLDLMYDIYSAFITIDGLHRSLNGLSADVDELTILEQSQKRLNKAVGTNGKELK